MITGRNPNSICTVASFEDALGVFQEQARAFSDKHVVYRGHADTSWRVVPSIFRQKQDISVYEAQIIRDLISLFPNDFLNDKSMFDRLVRMQHYGLPTRLLDVTKNPLVALYFAVDPDEDQSADGAIIIFAGDPARHKFYDSDVVSCMANLANLKDEERRSLATSKATTISEFNALKPATRLLQFIKEEKPYFLPQIQKVDLFRPISVTPKRSNQRMSAQAGQFLLFGLESRSGPSYEKSSKIIKCTIKANAKAEIRDRLDSLGIDGSTLFPEIDKATKRLTQRYISRVSPFRTPSAPISRTLLYPPSFNLRRARDAPRLDHRW